jgi:hypothetical protein
LSDYGRRMILGSEGPSNALPLDESIASKSDAALPGDAAAAKGKGNEGFRDEEHT